jgi:alpha-mannosidase
MNIIRCLIVSLLLPVVLSAQTNVDKLVKALDSLSLASFNEWKVSPDLKGFKPIGDPTKAGFDDSSWETLKLNQNIYPDSCWIRKEIVMPSKILGKTIKGPMKLEVSVDDYGYMWINGVSKGYFPWDGEFELTKDAKSGDRYLIVIKAINTGGPLRLIRAQISSTELQPLRSMIENLSLSMRVGQKLLGFDTYQTSSNKRVDPKTDLSTMDKVEKKHLSEILQSAATNVDLRALIDGPMEKFEASLANVRMQLKPVDAYAKRFTLYFNSNAHIDAAWLWRSKETIEVCKNTFASVLNMFNARQDFTYTQSAAAYYDWMERLYPELFKEIQKWVKDGRWEVVGGMWIEPDCNLPSGESWARHLLYAKSYFRQKLGEIGRAHV